jgi:leucyl/phenylalanyl-tRNA---protein transferase
MIPWLDHSLHFPPPASALAEPNGLIAAGGDLSAQRLLAAYHRGIFPWYSPDEPILWWSPNPRMVLFPDELHVPRSLAKALRNRDYTVRFDTAFADVMTRCAAPRPGQDGTWIGPDIIAAYCKLHALGFAHSVETWIDDQLVGGLYGVAIGRVFFGESMFALSPDASKIAFVHLVRQLQGAGFKLIDCQMQTHHLSRFGGRPIPRDDFLRHLEQHLHHASAPDLWLRELTPRDYRDD